MNTFFLEDKSLINEGLFGKKKKEPENPTIDRLNEKYVSEINNFSKKFVNRIFGGIKDVKIVPWYQNNNKLEIYSLTSEKYGDEDEPSELKSKYDNDETYEKIVKPLVKNINNKFNSVSSIYSNNTNNEKIGKIIISNDMIIDIELDNHDVSFPAIFFSYHISYLKSMFNETKYSYTEFSKLFSFIVKIFDGKDLFDFDNLFQCYEDSIKCNFVSNRIKEETISKFFHNNNQVRINENSFSIKFE